MAKTIFNITREDLNSEELETWQEKARDFLGVPEKEEVKETQEQVVQEVEEKLEEGDFGKPDTKQQEILDKMPKELRETLEGKLFFKEKTTEIIIDSGKKLIFDKKQHYKEDYSWDIAIRRVESIGQRLLTITEMEELFNLFKIGEKYYGDELKNILNLIQDGYWSNTDNQHDPDVRGAWYSDFKTGEKSLGKIFNNYILSVHSD